MDEYTVNRRGILKSLGILSLLVGIVLSFYFLMQKNITIDYDGKIMEVKSFASTVEGCLDNEGIHVQKQGYINYPLDAKLEDNMYLVVKEPKEYTIEIGKEIKKGQISPFEKVEDILDDLDIELGSKDYTEPKLEDVVENGDTIKLFKVKEVVEERKVELDYGKVIKDNANIDQGVTNTLQKGQKGEKVEHLKKTFVNGELESTELVKEDIVKEPVDEIKERGTRALVATSRGNTKFKDSIVMNASAYDLSYESTGKRPGDKYYGITASGTKARPGVVAVDPRVIPLGTKLYIESLDGTPDYGFATAEDTGGAIKGNKIDLFFETRNQVRSFGRRNVKVYILD